MATVDADVAALLAAGVGGGIFIFQPALELGTNLFTGPVRPSTGQQPGPNTIPTKAVFCLETGGPAPTPYLGSGTNFCESGVQVRVRGEQGDFANGLILAKGCLTVLQQAVPTGYTALLVQESSPNYLGEDPQGCHEWSINARVYWTG